MMFGAVAESEPPGAHGRWHFFTMTVSNVVVIVLTLAVFAVGMQRRSPATAEQEDSP